MRGASDVLEFDFENSVGCWITLTSHALRRALNEELKREGITFRQWEVLAWSGSKEKLSQAELAERMGIEAPTLGGILSRMARDGWLARSGCPHDRRKKRFCPTPKAEAVWNRMLQCCHQVRGRADRRAHDRGACRVQADVRNHPAEPGPRVGHAGSHFVSFRGIANRLPKLASEFQRRPQTWIVIEGKLAPHAEKLFPKLRVANDVIKAEQRIRAGS